MTQQIIVLFGVEIRDYLWQWTEGFLKANCDAKPSSTDTFTFPKGSGSNATYEVQVKFGLADFVTALNTPGAVVVYCGHSRYGQGPAFGPAKTGEQPDVKRFPINPWGVHYRMGYDATDTKCIADIMRHSTMPKEYVLPLAGQSAFLSDGLSAAAATARTVSRPGCRTNGAWREFDVCQMAWAKTKTARGDSPLLDRSYYSQTRENGHDEFTTAVTVGSADLDKTNLPGKLLVMGSCSSKVHFFAALDRRRQAAKSNCRFMLTAQVCYLDTATEFLNAVLIDKLDPTTLVGMLKIVRRLNGIDGSGLIGLY